MINIQATAATFIPVHPVELHGVYSSVSSILTCAKLCNQDPQCRTVVFDPPSCVMYESSFNTGSTISSPSVNSTVASVNFDNIHLASAYNKSCDYCYMNRYLVCINNTCQCPLNTVWDGEDKCINTLYPTSTVTCKTDNWCRSNLSLTCQCGKCRCPSNALWNNEECVPRFLQGMSCNTSDQCRSDLNLTCSRTNKTCTLMNLKTINITNGTIPEKYSNLGLVLDGTSYEWFRAIDGLTNTFWDARASGVTDYILFTFNDLYLLTSLQITVRGDGTHDPQTIKVFSDENGTCLIQSFSIPPANSTYYTFQPSPFDYINNPVATKQVLLAIDRYSIYQLFLAEVTFTGAFY